jgi:threonine dehydrogenase-like Zn-dependent dehydrogenase
MRRRGRTRRRAAGACRRPGTSLIRLTAAELCGSDLHWFGEGAIGDAAVVTGGYSWRADWARLS